MNRSPEAMTQEMIRIEAERHLRAAADLSEIGEGKRALDHMEEAMQYTSHMIPDRKRQT